MAVGVGLPGRCRGAMLPLDPGVPVLLLQRDRRVGVLVAVEERDRDRPSRRARAAEQRGRGSGVARPRRRRRRRRKPSGRSSCRRWSGRRRRRSCRIRPAAPSRNRSRANQIGHFHHGGLASDDGSADPGGVAGRRHPRAGQQGGARADELSRVWRAWLPPPPGLGSFHQARY